VPVLVFDKAFIVSGLDKMGQFVNHDALEAARVFLRELEDEPDYARLELAGTPLSLHTAHNELLDPAPSTDLAHQARRLRAAPPGPSWDRRRTLRGSLEDSFERLRHRFKSAIHTLTDDESDLLLDVFALTPDTENIHELMPRRTFHGNKIGRKVHTIRTRESAALKALHSRLVTGRYAQAPLVLNVPKMHGGLIYEETSTLIVIENRRWQATYEHYTFVHMAGELDYITIGRSYPGTVTPSGTGAFKVKSRDVDGAGWNDYFWHLNTDRTAVEPM
jgi:hypothetical protein